jgi:hypothetical protein
VAFNERGEMNITKLEAAKMYTFSVRNVSKELEISSAPIGIRQITRRHSNPLTTPKEFQRPL